LFPLPLFQNVTLKSVQAPFPKRSRLRDPQRSFLEGQRVQPADVLAAIYFPLNQSRTFQNFEVLGDGIQGNGKPLRDIGDPGGLFAELTEDGSSGWVRHGSENAIESGRKIFNHKVEYKAGLSACQRETRNFYDAKRAL
jgi:hypothetical protein